MDNHLLRLVWFVVCFSLNKALIPNSLSPLLVIKPEDVLSLLCVNQGLKLFLSIHRSLNLNVDLLRATEHYQNLLINFKAVGYVIFYHYSELNCLHLRSMHALDLTEYFNASKTA